MVQDRDQHRRHTAKPVALFLLNGFKSRERVESFPQINDCSAECDAADAAQNHGPDMVQRQRCTHAVAFDRPCHYSKEVPVVQQPVMRQCRCLRRSGGAGGELDIDWVIGLDKQGQFV